MGSWGSKWIRRRMARWTAAVTPRMRNRAAMLCAFMASSDEEHLPGYEPGDFGAVCRGAGAACSSDNGPAELARLALWSSPGGGGREDWAEAEAMLRTGWTP